VDTLREALAPLNIWLDASAGEGRSETIMLQQEIPAPGALVPIHRQP
jgi:hypothetical protein